MQTKSTNGVLDPRLYQVFGDNIDSKQAMEPLAIAIGPGPVSGFNAVSYDPVNNTVSFTSFDDPEVQTSTYPKNRGYTEGNGYKAISDPSNTIARPLNAHITRDGLLHTSTKITLPFTPLNDKWPTFDSSTSPDFGISFILKAKHTYIGQAHSSLENPVTFDIIDILSIDKNAANPWSLLSNHSYTTLCESLSIDGHLDLNTETLIGMYIIGWDPSWEPNYDPEKFKYAKLLSRDLGWVTSMVFYNGRMPYLSPNPLVLDKCNRVVDSLEYLTSQSVGYLSIDIEDEAVSVFKLTYKDKEVTPNEDYDEVILDTGDISNGQFIVEYTDRTSSLTGIDFDTLVTQATLHSTSTGNRRRVELVQYFTKKVNPTDNPFVSYLKHYFRFWIDPDGGTQIPPIQIRGIVKVNK